MATALRTVRHEDQLSLVEHLDELRTRLIVSLFAFLVCFGLAFWQNDAILEIVNRPFIKATSGQKAKGALAKTRTFNRSVGDFAASASAFAAAVEADSDASPATQGSRRAAARAGRQRWRASIPPAERQPVTLGVAEPFTSTLRWRPTPRCCSRCRSFSGSCTPSSCRPSRRPSAGSPCR